MMRQWTSYTWRPCYKKQKNNPWLAYQLPLALDQTYRQQIHHLDSCKRKDVGRGSINSKDTWDKHWMPLPPWSCNPVHPSFYEPATWSPHKSSKEMHGQDQQQIQQGLEMMLGFLEIANKGISLNSIAFWWRAHIYRLDLCPHGLRGYSHKGWAWRWYLWKNLLVWASNNLLKHLVTIISPWVDILAGHLHHQDYVFSMTNSTTAEGWLKNQTSLS